MANGQPQPDHGKTLLTWSFLEFEHHERSFLWYMAAVPVGLAMLVWTLFQQSYLFAVIIVIASFILARQHRAGPKMLTLRITEDGIDIAGRHFYLFRDLQSFWMVYDPPRTKRLFFTFKGGFRPTLAVALEDMNPLDVRRALAQYIPEDLEREDEPTLEALARLLKL